MCILSVHPPRMKQKISGMMRNVIVPGALNQPSCVNHAVAVTAQQPEAVSGDISADRRLHAVV